MGPRENAVSENDPGKNFQLHEIAASDLEELVRFITRVSGSNAPHLRALQRLSWILLENPARNPDDPLGWLLRSQSGEVVGCMCCTPQEFCCGQTTLKLMMANSFYVDDQYRGGGTSIFLKYLQLARRYPLFVSSANPTVAEMWQKLGGYPLGNSDHEILGILRWPPLLEESMYRKTSSNRIARFTSAIASPWPGVRRLGVRSELMADDSETELRPLATPEEAAAICAQHHSDKITNCRDAAFLKWRYFSPANSTTRVFAFHPRYAANANDASDAGKKQFMVAVHLHNRGYRQQIRALHVLDIWGEADAKTCLEIAASLWREYREQIDMLVFRCLDAPQREALKAHGFKVRAFPAPIAWCIDKYGLLPSKSWYFVPADGDMLL
jgi:hypothetical protein